MGNYLQIEYAANVLETSIEESYEGRRYSKKQQKKVEERPK